MRTFFIFCSQRIRKPTSAISFGTEFVHHFCTENSLFINGCFTIVQSFDLLCLGKKETQSL